MLQTRTCALALSALLSFTFASHAASSTPDTQADKDKIDVTDVPFLPGEGDQRIYCLEALERILPGDYYGCRALYHLQRAHYRQAMAMLKEAAYWANKEAQHQLGLAYINGDLPGIAADRPRGVAWLALALERRQPDYERDYALAIAHTGRAEQEQAARIYLDLRKRYGDAVAGKRATNRFNHEIQAIDEAAQDPGGEVAGFGPVPMRAYTVSRRLHDEAEQTFAGLQGSVLVGPLQTADDRIDTATLPRKPVPSPAVPAASSSH